MNPIELIRKVRQQSCPDFSMEQVHLWLLPIIPENRVSMVAMPRLSWSENNSIERCLNQQAREIRRSSYIWTRLILAWQTGLRPDELVIERTLQGKPFLSNKPDMIDFNVSHSGPYLVLACNRGAVGVDLEQHHPALDLHAISHYLFGSSQPEFEDSPSGKSIQSFFDYWVTHEALQKCCGAAAPDQFLPLQALAPCEGTLKVYNQDLSYTRPHVLMNFSLCVATRSSKAIKVHTDLLV